MKAVSLGALSSSDSYEIEYQRIKKMSEVKKACRRLETVCGKITEITSKMKHDLETCHQDLQKMSSGLSLLNGALESEPTEE